MDPNVTITANVIEGSSSNPNVTSGATVQTNVVEGTPVTGNVVTGGKGDKGDQGDPGVVQAVVAGTNVTVDNTDPANPIVSASGDVASVNGQTGVVVLDQDDIGDGTTYKQYSATEKTKLSGIETGADVTDATNVNAAGATMNADTSLVGNGYFLDEDNMASDDATKVPSQQSVKAYVDANSGGDVDSVNGQTGVVVLDSDDISEGTTNLYSQWEVQTYGTPDYLQAIGNEGLVVGADVPASLSSTFDGAAAYFNGDVNGSNNGINFFINAAYGTGFGAYGAFVVNASANGTPASPTQTLDSKYLGGMTFAGVDELGGWVISGSSHFLPGLIARAASDATSGVMESDIYLGGLLTKMIGFETDTNAIKFNEAQLDSDITFYYDAGTALSIDGATGTVSAPGSASGTVHIGDGSTATGQNSTAFGSNATATSTNSVVIGRASTDGGFSGSVVLGFGASSTGANSFSLGRGASAASQSIAIGYNADATAGSTSVVLGRDAVNTTSNQFVAGATVYHINDIYFGSGVLSATPIDYTINGTGGSGTDIGGGDITIAGGKNTGAGAGGSIIFQTSPAGASGATLATLATRMTISSTGLVSFANSASFNSGNGFDWGGTDNDMYANTGTGVVTVRGVNEIDLRIGSTVILATTSTGVAVTGDVTVTDEAYGAGWDGSLEVPTKNAVYDKIETISGGGGLTYSQVVSITSLGV